MESIWDRFGFDLGSIWVRFGIDIVVDFGVDLGVDLGSIWGRFTIDLGSIWGRFEVDLGSIWGSISGLGRVLGALGEALGGLGVARSAQDRILIDFGSILEPVLGPKTGQNRSEIDAKRHSNSASVFGSIFNRFLIDLRVHLGTILGPCWVSTWRSAT